jgi:hypothetical protein
VTTLDAVNSILAQEHSHAAWRREVRHLAHRVAQTDYRAHAKTAAHGRSFAARLYDWLLTLRMSSSTAP